MKAKTSKSSAKCADINCRSTLIDGLSQLKSRKKLKFPSFSKESRDAQYLKKLSTYDPFYWLDKCDQQYCKEELYSTLDGNAPNRTIDVYMVYKIKNDPKEDAGEKKRHFSVGIVFRDATAKNIWFKGYYLGFKEPDYAYLNGFLFMLKKAESLSLTKLRLHGHLSFLSKFVKGNFDKIDEFYSKICNEIDKLVAQLTVFSVTSEPRKSLRFVKWATEEACEKMSWVETRYYSYEGWIDLQYPRFK